MEISVRTRGRRRELDYQFLGQAPEDFWWRQYRSVTDIERPTILLRSDGTSWQAYVAGIRSARLDATANVIQFNLVLSGDCGQGRENAIALGVIARSVTDLADQGGMFIAGDQLDEQLPDDKVQGMLTAPGKQTAAAAAAAVLAAYGPCFPPSESAPPKGNWIGGLTDPWALGAFVAHSAALLDSDHPGSALVLNLVEDDLDIIEFPTRNGVIGVLAARPGPFLGMAVRTLGKAEPPPWLLSMALLPRS